MEAHEKQELRQKLQDALRDNTSLTDHRAAADGYDLSGFEGSEPRTVHVTFGMPEWQAERKVTNAILQPLLKQPDITEEAAQELNELAQSAIREYAQEKAQEGWSATRKHGNVTVVFDEDFTNMESPANPKKSDLQAPADKTLAIDGFMVACEREEKLTTSIPGAVKWIDGIKTINQDGTEQLASKLTLSDGDAYTGANNVAISLDNVSIVGDDFLRHEALNMEVIKSVLRHERGHFVNGDTGGTQQEPREPNLLTQAGNKLQYIKGIESFVQSINSAPEAFAAYLQKMCATPEKGKEALSNIKSSLDALAPALKETARQLKEYPWFDEVDGMSVAADADNPTSFAAYVVKNISGYVEEHKGLVFETYYFDQSLRSNELPPLRADMTPLVEDIRKMGAEHPDLLADIATIHHSHNAISQAAEYLADIHSVRHTEDLGSVSASFEFAETRGARPNGDRGSHPHRTERLEMNKHFAERVKLERGHEKSDYIDIPPLPTQKDKIPPYTELLRETLESQLLQHRTRVKEYDLSGFADHAAQTVHVTFGAPRWQMEDIAAELRQAYDEEGFSTDGMDEAAMQVIDAHIDQCRKAPWSHTQQHGNTTVIFDEAVAQDNHPSNPAQTTQNHSFDYSDGYVSINGRCVVLSRDKALQKQIPGLARWIEQINEVETQTHVPFHPAILVQTSRDRAAVSGRGLVVLGGKFIDEITEPDIMRHILQHERAHLVHGDFDMSIPATAALDKLEHANKAVGFVTETLTLLKNPSIIRSANPQKDIDLAANLGSAFKAMLGQAGELAETIHHYPDFDTMDGMSIAADLNNKTSFAHHLESAIELDSTDLEAALGALKANAASNPPANSAEGQPEAEVDAFNEAFSRHVPYPDETQLGACTDIRQSYYHLSQGVEYAADVYSAKNSDTPETFHRMAEKFTEMDIHGGGTHPKSQERAEMGKHFAQRVLHQRAAAKDTPVGRS